MTDEAKAAEVKRLAWYEYLRVLYELSPEQPTGDMLEGYDICTAAVAKVLGQYEYLSEEVKAKVESL